MTPSEKVAAIEEIKRLKAKYCRLVDYNDRAELRKLFTDDIVYEFENWSKGQGGDAFAGSAETFEDRRSVHRVDMPEIEILSRSLGQDRVSRLRVLPRGVPQGRWWMANLFALPDPHPDRAAGRERHPGMTSSPFVLVPAVARALR